MPNIISQGAGSAQGFGFAARSNAAVYIEDVFSTYLYAGNGGTTTVVNGIDLSTKGGMVWTKMRDYTTGVNHGVWDTARGAGTSNTSNKTLSTNTTDQESVSQGDYISSFNTNGFTAVYGGGMTAYYWNNRVGANYVSWTFRKQPKFFDVVTYTGNGVSGRTVSHNLGSVPGCIIVKRINTPADDWYVYHRSSGATINYRLNTTSAALTQLNKWNNTEPTSTVFTVGDDAGVNANGATYVAYLFAHDAGGFGASGTDNVITCGSFTADGSGNATVTLGYEPQFLMYKASSTTGNWVMADNMRGWTASGELTPLRANLSDAEGAATTIIGPTATGFKTYGNISANQTYIYIAIRRGPMRTPTSGTSVFAPVTYTGNNTSGRVISSSITVDSSWIKGRSIAASATVVDRLRGGAYIRPPATSSQDGSTTYYPSNPFATQTGVIIGNDSGGNGYTNTSSETYIDWQFRRAPGVFDTVCYTGTGSATTFNHNLGIAPEFMIVKSISGADSWIVYHSAMGATKYVLIDGTQAAATDSTMWNNTAPTSTVFSVGSSPGTATNLSGTNYVAYLFATVAGVSKVGTYTGTGTTLQVDCGFSGGARFVMIRRTSTGGGDWYVWDSARGIVSGNDPYLLLNSTDAEVTGTDYVDTYSAGFEISSTAPAAINANGGTFIFLAIA